MTDCDYCHQQVSDKQELTWKENHTVCYAEWNQRYDSGMCVACGKNNRQQNLNMCVDCEKHRSGYQEYKGPT